MKNSDSESYIETLKFCEDIINRHMIEIIKENSKSGVKEISVNDEIYKRYHNFLKHRYNLDQIRNQLFTKNDC